MDGCKGVALHEYCASSHWYQRNYFLKFVFSLNSSSFAEVKGQKGAKGGDAADVRAVDVSRLDMRVGVVLSVEKVSSEDRLEDVPYSICDSCNWNFRWLN